MSRLHTIYNIKPIRSQCFQCSHPISFSFFGSFPSVLSINVTDASFRKPFDPQSENVYISVPAYKTLSYQTLQHSLDSYSIYYKTDLIHPCIVCYTVCRSQDRLDTYRHSSNYICIYIYIFIYICIYIIYIIYIYIFI